VSPATCDSARCPCRFHRFRSGPDTAGTGCNPRTGPTSPARSHSIDILTGIDGLRNRLRHAGHDMPECLCCSRTGGDHRDCYAQFRRGRSLHSQLHDATASLQAGVQPASPEPSLVSRFRNSFHHLELYERLTRRSKLAVEFICWVTRGKRAEKHNMASRAALTQPTAGPLHAAIPQRSFAFHAP
jgi:hypothetical protein